MTQLNFFRPTPGKYEKTWTKIVFLLLAIIAWSILGTIITAVAYMSWPSPRQAWQEYIAGFGAFIPLFALMFLLPLLQGRPARTAITGEPRLRWKLIWVGLWTWGVLLVAESAIKFVINPASFTFSFDLNSYFLPFIICLLLLPIQTSSEELLFRGAIPQALAGFLKNPLIVVVISGLLFGAAHMANPEAQADPVISLIGYSVTGIGWGWVTYRTVGLELAIGAHTINNFFGLLIVGYSNSAIISSSIWSTPSLDMTTSTISSIIMMTLWIIMVRRYFQPKEAMVSKN